MSPLAQTLQTLIANGTTTTEELLNAPTVRMLTPAIDTNAVIAALVEIVKG